MTSKQLAKMLPEKATLRAELKGLQQCATTLYRVLEKTGDKLELLNDVTHVVDGFAVHDTGADIRIVPNWVNDRYARYYQGAGEQWWAVDYGIYTGDDVWSGPLFKNRKQARQAALDWVLYGKDEVKG